MHTVRPPQWMSLRLPAYKLALQVLFRGNVFFTSTRAPHKPQDLRECCHALCASSPVLTDFMPK